MHCWKHHDNLPEKIQELAAANFALIKSDPYHPSLHFKALTSELWSVRIGLHYRALAMPEAGGFVWIWIGSHGDYDRLVRQ
jgi:hypothetical protein